MNENNLISFNKMDKARLSEISKKGGINSGIARRKKRDEFNKAVIQNKAELCAIGELIHDMKYYMNVINRQK